jgi:PAT family beta-lactamase induction signal transducer AmpG
MSLEKNAHWSWSWLAAYLDRRILAVLLLGISSGLPLALTGATLSTWLGDNAIDKATIGIFSWVGLPYVFKFIWAPLADHLRPPAPLHRLGRRRGWMLFTQATLAIAIAMMGMLNPAEYVWWLGLAAVCVAFLAASQDIVIDAYRAEYLPRDKYGEGAAVATFGYRLGMVLSGAGALYLADWLDNTHGVAEAWKLTYFAMAACMLIGIVTVLCISEPEPVKKSAASASLAANKLTFLQWCRKAVVGPFTQFTHHRGWLYLLIFVAVFRFSDAFIGFLVNPFLIDIGFTKSQIASITKVYGLFAILAGTALGGAFIRWFGLYPSLGVCAVMQIGANLIYILQARMGADVAFLTLTITADNLNAGMMNAVVITFLMRMCDREYMATQFALLSSLTALGMRFFSGFSGFVQEAAGWDGFFFIGALLGIPAIIMWIVLPRYANADLWAKDSSTPQEAEAAKAE